MFQTGNIRLADGWRGEALIGAYRPAGGPRPLPTLPQWRTGLDALVFDPSRLAGYEVLKHSRSSEVFRVRLEELPTAMPVVVKRTVRSGRNRLADLARLGRARRNFRIGLMLLEAGIPTATPLAWMVRRRTRESMLVTAFVPDLVDLDHVALGLLPRMSAREAHRTKQQLAEQVVALLVKLDRCGLHHRDLKASNILLDGLDAGGPGSAWLLDLEGLRRSRLRCKAHRRQRLVRLAASLSAYASVTCTDYVRFLKTYVARSGSGLIATDDGKLAWKHLFRELDARAARYVRRAQRRKSDKLDGYAA